MFKKVILAMLLGTVPLSAQTPLPKPCAGGDYWTRSEHTWLHWEVTGAELEGRLTPAWPEDEEDPEALLEIDWMVPRWPVVVKFSKGDLLQAVTDENGGVLIKDVDGGTWIKVKVPGGGFCFVRASAKFVRPVVSQALGAAHPLPEANSKRENPPSFEYDDIPEPDLVDPVYTDLSE